MHRLTVQLPSEPPDEFRIFRAGQNDTSKGAFFFSERSAELVMAAAREWGNEYSLDYEHAAVSDIPVPAPAAGWYALEVRDGELWAANVRWTPRAAEMLRVREYRYISPAFLANEEREITQLINVALTNLPATKRQLPLVARRNMAAQGGTMNLQTLTTALGLGSGASEADVQLAVLALRNFERELLSMTGAASREEAHGVLTAWRQSHEQLPQVLKQLETLRADVERRERERMIEAALREGKLTPAMRPWATEAPIDMLRAYLAVAPRLIPEETREPGRVAPQRWDELTPIQKHQLYLTDRETYEALKAEAEGAR